MPDLELTPVGRDEVPAFLHAAEVPFHDTVHDADLAYWTPMIEPERALAVREGGRIVATGASMTMDVSVPDAPPVAMAGVTVIAVWPSHRRRGLAARPLARVHDDARERGEPLAGLWASESKIYGRFGYGPAARMAHYELATAEAAFHTAVEVRGRVRLVEPGEAIPLLLDLYERERTRTPGMPRRGETMIAGLLTRDPEHWRGGAGARFLAAYGDRGLVSYRVAGDWSSGYPAHTVKVEELHAADDEAYAGLWRFLCDLDLVARVEARMRPVDEALPQLLADPRRVSTTGVVDSLWLRVLDVPATLEARGYATGGAVTIEVVDPAGYAAGRYRLEADGGKGTCAPTAQPADVTLPVASLGAAVLGGTRLTALARAGRAGEHEPGSLRRLDLMLSSDRQPWCPVEF